MKSIFGENLQNKAQITIIAKDNVVKLIIEYFNDEKQYVAGCITSDGTSRNISSYTFSKATFSEVSDKFQFDKSWPIQATLNTDKSEAVNILSHTGKSNSQSINTTMFRQTAIEDIKSFLSKVVGENLRKELALLAFRLGTGITSSSSASCVLQ